MDSSGESHRRFTMKTAFGYNRTQRLTDLLASNEVEVNWEDDLTNSQGWKIIHTTIGKRNCLILDMGKFGYEAHPQGDAVFCSQGYKRGPVGESLSLPTPIGEHLFLTYFHFARRNIVQEIALVGIVRADRSDNFLFPLRP